MNPSRLRSRDDKLLMFLLDVYPELQAKAEWVQPHAGHSPSPTLILWCSRQAKTSCGGDELSEYSDDSSMDHNYDRLNDIDIDDTNFVDVPSFVAPFDSNRPMQNTNSINYNRVTASELFGARADEHNRRTNSPVAPMWSAQPFNAVDKFLLGLGATICTFPAIEIAKLKIELSNIVFNKELELAEARAKSN